MATKNRLYRRVMAMFLSFMMISSVVVTPFAGTANAALEGKTIGGRTLNGVSEPLKITVQNNGVIAAYLLQSNRYVGQYYANSSWGTNLIYTESGKEVKYQSPFFYDQGVPANHPLGEGTITLVDDNTIVTTWALDSGNVELKQTIYYPTNERYYEKEWTIENKSGTKTYSNLKLTHGGDATFGGEDSARAYWDPLLNMVYLKNRDMTQFGLMGLAGKNTSPADQYFGGDFYAGRDQAANGQLNNSSDSNNTDAGYYLQWNHNTLAPNEKWVVQSIETWTPAGALQVIAPPSQTTASNSTVTYMFKLQNFQADADVFDLNVTSSRGWQTIIREGSTVSVPGDGAIKTVTVDLVVPAGMSGTDTLTLTGTSQSKGTVTNSGNVITTINNALPVISSVSAQPNRAQQGDAVTVPVTVQTANVPDGAAVEVELVDENKQPLSPAVKANGTIVNNGAVVSLPISSSLTKGTYYIDVTVAGVSAKHGSTPFTITDSNNADLLHLVVSEGTLDPVFRSDITDYSVSVTESVYDITVTGAVYNSNSKLVINGVSVPSGQASQPIKLKVGSTIIPVVVTAADGITTKTYLIDVKKAASHKALLLNMGLSSGTLSPGFSSGTTNYKVVVGNSTDQLSVTDLVYSPKATISVTGATYHPITGDYTLPLQVGENEIQIIVTAEDGITQTIYILKAYRQSPHDQLFEAAKELFIGYAAGDSWESVTKQVTLPIQGKHNTTITWESSHPHVLSSNGVINPSPTQDTTVKLTATVEKDGIQVMRTFLVIVKKGSLHIVNEDQTRTVPVRVGEGNTDVEQVSITRKTMSDGTIIDKVVVDPAKYETAWKRAQEQNQSSVRLVVTDIPKDQANEVAVEVPLLAYSPLANVVNMTIETDGAHLVLAKGTLQQLKQDGSDLFFRFVPIRAAQQKEQLKQQAVNDAHVKQTAGNKHITVVGTPMVIETNYTARETKVVFPLDKLQAPTAPSAQLAYLQSLYVYIQHSDGEKSLKQGVIERDAAGNIVGLSIMIDKFSTFTLLQLDTPASGGNNSSSGSITGTTSPIDPNKDKDTSKDPNKDAAQQVNHMPYIKGYKDGSFRPDSSITRAELAVMLWKIDKEGAQATTLSGKGNEGNGKGESFKDVKQDHWAREAIEALRAKGVMMGVGNGEFEPNRPMTRAELAATVARWKQLKAEQLSQYADVQGHWAAKHIAALTEAGAVHGYKDGQFRPNANVTRAETVTMLNRLLKRGPLHEVAKPTWSDVQAKHWAYGDIEEASQAHTAELLPKQGERFLTK